MKARKIKPDLRLVYEQSERGRDLLLHCETADAKAAEHIRKCLSEPDPMLEEAENAAARGDPETILMWLDNTARMAFVFDNIEWLKASGKYETCLVEAYTGTRTNYAHWSLSALKLLFRCADRDRLLAAGHPMPPGDTFTLYRGVAGRGKKRRPPGPSWTSNLETAKWFALRFLEEGNPAIYTATVQREDVLFYCNEREEDDFVLFVDCPKRMPIDLKGQKNAGWAGAESWALPASGTK